MLIIQYAIIDGFNMSDHTGYGPLMTIGFQIDCPLGIIKIYSTLSMSLDHAKQELVYACRDYIFTFINGKQIHEVFADQGFSLACFCV